MRALARRPRFRRNHRHEYSHRSPIFARTPSRARGTHPARSAIDSSEQPDRARSSGMHSSHNHPAVVFGAGDWSPRHRRGSCECLRQRQLRLDCAGPPSLFVAACRSFPGDGVGWFQFQCRPIPRGSTNGLHPRVGREYPSDPHGQPRNRASRNLSRDDDSGERLIDCTCLNRRWIHSSDNRNNLRVDSRSDWT